MKKYMVRLTPVETYFFGGEATFGDDTKQNYYVRSNRLPQVSTLIGMLRYEVLRQKNLLYSYNEDKTKLPDKKSKIKDAVGEVGFVMDENVSHYGIIQKISPLFIENRKLKKFYTPLPLDFGINVHEDSSFQMSCVDLSEPIGNGNDTECNNVGYACTAMKAEGFDAKEYDNYLYWVDNENNKVSADEIFYQKEQVGITKTVQDPTDVSEAWDDSNAFYKQITYGLHADYGFAFTMTVSEDIKQVSTKVFMGGNRSVFKMEITELTEDEEKNYGDSFCNYFGPLHKKGRYMLLGDAYFSNEELYEIPFLWAQSQCNRYIVKRYDSGVDWKKPVKTDILFRLLTRGGVIYTEELPESKEYLTNVGLNIFI